MSDVEMWFPVNDEKGLDTRGRLVELQVDVLRRSRTGDFYISGLPPDWDRHYDGDTMNQVVLDGQGALMFSHVRVYKSGPGGTEKLEREYLVFPDAD